MTDRSGHRLVLLSHRGDSLAGSEDIGLTRATRNFTLDRP